MGLSRTSILLVGTYHFLEDHRTDLYSCQVQDELDEIVARLSRFRPDAIAVEAPISSQTAVSQSYRRVALGAFRDPELMRTEELGHIEFGGARYPITYANEAIQIGYRLAKLLGHSDVYAIDADVSLETDAIYSRAHSEIQGWAEATRLHEIKAGEALATAGAGGSITGLLCHYNTVDLAKQNSIYYLEPAMVGAGADYSGAKYLLKWYDRNIRTFANLQRLSMRHERVLMLWGAGHMPILKELIRACRTLSLADTLEYL